MPAFKRFGPGDQIDNVLVLEPRYELTSGSVGWRGSPEGSASLNLYGGARRSPSGIFRHIEYQSNYPNAGQVGNPRRGFPLTASVNYVWMTDENLPASQVTSVRWGEEHWDTVIRLYQDHYPDDADYVTGSYDFYCLYFNRDSANILAFNSPQVVKTIYPSSSFTIESWVKPFATSSLTNDFTIASMNRGFWFGITGSTGRLVLSSSAGSVSASAGPAIDRWSHVSVAYDGTTLTGTFRINLADAGTFGMPALIPPNSFTASFTIGQRWSGTLGAGGVERADSSPSSGLPRRSFHGFIGESRFWIARRTDAQLSSSWDRTLTGSEASGAIVSTRLCEGPLGLYAENHNFSPGPAPGSGTVNQSVAAHFDVLDFTAAGAGTTMWGYMRSFSDRPGPTWHPNDNVRFRPPKALVGLPASGALGLINSEEGETNDGYGLTAINRMVIIDVPSAFYGREISRNSVSLTCRAFSSGSHGLVRTLVDDGRGGLYLSGSASSSSLSVRDDFAGVGWNKVGNVFYGEGLIVIRDPSLLDFGRTDGASSHPNDTMQLSFRGLTMLPVKTLMCRVDRGERNASANPTFSTVEEDGAHVRSHPSGSLRISTVGIYNSDRELVGVARLADPIRVRERDRLNIKLRMDF